MIHLGRQRGTNTAPHAHEARPPLGEINSNLITP
jgi:hypothetical protein